MHSLGARLLLEGGGQSCPRFAPGTAIAAHAETHNSGGCVQTQKGFPFAFSSAAAALRMPLRVLLLRNPHAQRVRVAADGRLPRAATKQACGSAVLESDTICF